MHRIESFYAFATKVHDIPKEDARFSFPNATVTEIVITCNLREWRHIIELRADKHAQWEIRQMAKEILTILYKECDSVFEDKMEKFM